MRWKKYISLLMAMVLFMFTLGNLSNVAYAAKGELGEGFDAANLDRIFVSVEEQEISSNSEGIVTILVFARTNGNCYNSNAVVSSLCESSWITDARIRLLVVDVDKSSKETVMAMQQENLADTAIFCYDTTYAANNTMWSYLDSTIGSEGRVTLPVTVLIDGQNKVQYCLTGYNTASELKPYVEELVGDELEEVEKPDEVELYAYGTFEEKMAFEVLEQVNQARLDNGLEKVTMDETLMEKAMQRAAECAVYYNHTRPNGESCFTVLDGGYLYGCAENIAYGYTTSAGVMNGWLNSQGHYENIMGSDYTHIGVGSFTQNGTTYWVQLFSVYGQSECTEKENSTELVKVTANKDYLGNFRFGISIKIEEDSIVAPYMAVRNLGSGADFVLSSENCANGIISILSSDTEVIEVIEGTSTICTKKIGNAMLTVMFDGAVVSLHDIEVIESTKPPFISGDANVDGKLDLSDVQYIMKIALNIEIPTGDEWYRAEVNEDDTVDLSDAQYVLKMVLKLIDVYDEE